MKNGKDREIRKDKSKIIIIIVSVIIIVVALILFFNFYGSDEVIAGEAVKSNVLKKTSLYACENIGGGGGFSPNGVRTKKTSKSQWEKTTNYCKSLTEKVIFECDGNKVKTSENICPSGFECITTKDEPYGFCHEITWCFNVHLNGDLYFGFPTRFENFELKDVNYKGVQTSGGVEHNNQCFGGNLQYYRCSGFSGDKSASSYLHDCSVLNPTSMGTVQLGCNDKKLRCCNKVSQYDTCVEGKPRRVETHYITDCGTDIVYDTACQSGYHCESVGGVVSCVTDIVSCQSESVGGVVSCVTDWFEE
ncbi:hypothetical protein J4437_02750 [Candidatus Woesearchaeota archaeon]|nr:hypothetical protein [Candidatus Woesearchaeota archaeon]